MEVGIGADASNRANALEIHASGLVVLAAAYAQTSDPLVAGAIWNDSGTLKFSAG